MPDDPSRLRPISRVWIDRIKAARLPTACTMVEVAPGQEPKVGAALAQLGFEGSLFVVEPDERAAQELARVYRQLLPRAAVCVIAKRLQEVSIGKDLPNAVTALVANHAFDDMVMSSILGHTSDPREEPYSSLTHEDYRDGIDDTVSTWTVAVERLRPACLVVSQYPVRLLERPGFEARQRSGLEVLLRLKRHYAQHAVEIGEGKATTRPNDAGSWTADPRWREDPTWWLLAQFRDSTT